MSHSSAGTDTKSNILPIKNITTKSDYEELKKAYQFIPPQQQQGEQRGEQGQGHGQPSASTNTETTWQDRMVIKYHAHLYKTHVIADFTKQTPRHPKNIGLRWRVQSEVINGKGFDTCGNKHCPCYYRQYDVSTSNSNMNDNDNDNDKKMMKTVKKKKSIEDVIRWKKSVHNRQILYNYKRELLSSKQQWQQGQQQQSLMLQKMEQQRLQKVPHGLGLYDYSVHFKYSEHGQIKEELVQLKLCLRCAPKLFYTKERQGQKNGDDDDDDKGNNTYTNCNGLGNGGDVGLDGGSLLRALYSRLESGSDGLLVSNENINEKEKTHCRGGDNEDDDGHKKDRKKKKRKHKRSKHSSKNERKKQKKTKKKRRNSYSSSSSSIGSSDENFDRNGEKTVVDKNEVSVIKNIFRVEEYDANDNDKHQEGKDEEKILLDDIHKSLDSKFIITSTSTTRGNSNTSA